MDSSEHYPDQFGEALSYSSQRAAQMASLVAAGVEVAARRRALSRARRAARDEQQLRALQDRQRAAQQQARAGWAPAHDQRWLALADLLQTAGTWGPPSRTPTPTRPQRRRCAKARNACALSILTR